jgi:hypothetical protein
MLAVCWVGVLGGCAGWVCWEGVVAVCWVDVLAVCWVGVAWMWPKTRAAAAAGMSVETWSLQDLVSHPRRCLSKEFQAEFIEFLLAEGNKASAVGKSGDALCYRLLVMGNAQRPKRVGGRLAWILSIRVVSRLHAHHTTPTRLYSNRFTALQCFYLSGSTPVWITPPQHRSQEGGENPSDEVGQRRGPQGSRRDMLRI